MGILSSLFGEPKPAPVVIIRNVLGEEIYRFPARDLYNQELRGNSGCTPTSAGCRYWVRIWKARPGQIFKRLHFAAQGSRSVTRPVQNFRGADLRECSLYRAEIGLSRRHSSADFTDALVNEATDIPEHKVFPERRLS